MLATDPKCCPPRPALGSAGGQSEWPVVGMRWRYEGRGSWKHPVTAGVAPWVRAQASVSGLMDVGFPVRRGAAELRGRQVECELLDRLVEAVRQGESQALVLRGEAGVGKTALLDYLAEHASGCVVARATGVQSEMELAFAGLQRCARRCSTTCNGCRVRSAMR